MTVAPNLMTSAGSRTVLPIQIASFLPAQVLLASSHGKSIASKQIMDGGRSVRRGRAHRIWLGFG